MSTKSEGRHTAEFLISEANGTRSRDQVTVTVPASTTLKPGLVLAKVTASGKYVPYDDDASDGRESAAGVLYHELVNASDAPADADATVITSDAEVRRADLEWDESIDAGEKTSGLADLLALGIKAR